MSAATTWWKERIGDVTTLRAVMSPPKGPASWARSLAIATVVAAFVAAVSGVGLAFTYAPSAASAWASVVATEYVLPGGWLVRSIHVASAEGVLVIGTFALLVSVVEGRYRGARDLAFYCLAVLVAAAFLFCMTGNPLRWDNRGYFGFQTEMNIAGELPGGTILRALAVGGAGLGNWTLTRLYAMHALVLPAATAVVLALWARVSARAHEGVADGEIDARDAQAKRDAAVLALVVVAMAVVASVRRAPLEAPADPIGSYNARPEWYFLSLYVLRNAVPATMQAIVAGTVPVLLGALVVALPRLDRDPKANLGARMKYIAPMALVVLGAGALTYAGVRHDETDATYVKARKLQDSVDKRAIQIALANGVPPSGGLAMMHEDPVFHAEDLYKQHCAPCHTLGDMGPKKGEDAAPSLDGFGTAKWVAKLLDDPDAATFFGPTGYKEKMPSFTHPPRDPERAKDWKAMTPEQIDSIAKYLANEAADAPKGHDPDGEKLVRQRCTSCHLLHGETDDPDGLAPELAHWGSVAWIRQQIADPGTMATYRPIATTNAIEHHMPAFAKKIAAADVDLLARFVHHRATSSTPK